MEFIVCSILCINAFFNWNVNENDNWNLGRFIHSGAPEYEESIFRFQPFLNESLNKTVDIQKTQNDKNGCSKVLITVRNIWTKKETPQRAQHWSDDKYFESKSLGVIVCKTKSV